MKEKINNNKFSDKLNEFFNSKIKFSFVSKYSVVIVTEIDKCYQFEKKNIKNLLIALSDNESKVNSLIEESIVAELTDKKVVDFKKGWNHFIARTLDGKVYCWGNNKNGVLGNGRYNRKTYNPQLNQFLYNEHIIDICCGRFHTLVLTVKNSVYAWGRNIEIQVGKSMSDSSGCQRIPIKLNEFNSEKVKAISCGSHHSLALTESGRVFSWGHNYFGQLGIGSETFSYSPKLIKLSEQLIFKKISCGFRHSLLLSDDGDIYVFGRNTCGELGIGDQDVISVPIKLIHSEKFIDIASHFNHSFSAAISAEYIHYIWGKCGEELITEPKQTKFKSFNDIFEHYFQITCKSVEGKVIRFNDDFTQNDKYENEFIEIEIIGEGSYGKVFEVNEKYNGKNYAMKMIKFQAKYNSEFLKELETLPIIYELKNKKIVKYFDVWLENDFEFKKGKKTFIENFILYIQMELCDTSLADVIDEIENDSNFNSNKILTPVGYYIASEIFIEILEGVNYLHKQKPPIIHRDLNPWNILLKTNKQSNSLVKIADLGLAIIHEYADQSHTQDRGHNKFLAPEVEDGRKYDTRADIYSLGIVSRKLYLIDVNGDYEIPNKSSPQFFFINKYQKISQICDKMTRTMVKERPEVIREILEERDMWALSIKELNLEEQIKKQLESNKSNEKIVFKILKNKFSIHSRSRSHKTIRKIS